MTSKTTDFARCFPVLPTLDLDETARFYHEQLGFSETVYRAEAYLIARRDEMELHFWLTDDVELPKVSSCYIRGGQIPSLHAEFSARGVPSLTPIEHRPWGMTEFYIHDPHGNLLRFGAATQEI